MYNDYLIQDEYDIFTEIYMKITYYLDIIEQETKLNKISRKYLTTSYKNITNQILDIALLNKSNYNYFDVKNLSNLPDNYFKPNKKYLNIIKLLYTIEEKDIDKLEALIHAFKENNDRETNIIQKIKDKI